MVEVAAGAVCSRVVSLVVVVVVAGAGSSTTVVQAGTATVTAARSARRRSFFMESGVVSELVFNACIAFGNCDACMHVVLFGLYKRWTNRTG